MHKKFNEIIEKYNDLNNQLNLASNTKDSPSIQRIAKEIGSINEIYSKALKIKKLEIEINEAEALIKDEKDEELLSYFNETINNKIKEKETIENDLLYLIEIHDPNDFRNAIVEIRAGTGGEEAALFASELYRLYLKYSERNNWKIEQISISYAAQGGIKEVIALISGNYVYGKLKIENGVHRVQRIPSTEASGRIHTSSASVVVLPEVEDEEVEINLEDIKVDTYRAGGPGGQGVNTTDSAIRLTHIPTGIVVSCQDERSQLKNKHRALSVLKSRLFDLQQKEANEKLSKERKNTIKTGDRSEKIKTYNFPQSRLTDHRIKHSWFNLSEIMEGDIDEIIETTKLKMVSGNDTINEN